MKFKIPKDFENDISPVIKIVTKYRGMFDFYRKNGELYMKAYINGRFDEFEKELNSIGVRKKRFLRKDYVV